MTEIITKLVITIIVLAMASIGSYLGLRVLKLTKRVKELEVDRNELLEERAKQSNALRLKGIEEDEANKERFVLAELEKRMILSALNMPEYKNAIKDPKTQHHVRKAYKELKEKIKESFEK